MKVFKRKTLCFIKRNSKELMSLIFKSQILLFKMFHKTSLDKWLKTWIRYHFDKPQLILKCIKKISLNKPQYVMKFIDRMLKRQECLDSIYNSHLLMRIRQIIFINLLTQFTLSMRKSKLLILKLKSLLKESLIIRKTLS